MVFTFSIICNDKHKQEKMKPIKPITILIFLISTICVVSGQQPKEIKVEGNYIHSPTKMTFPISLFDDYQREDIYFFDKENQNIGVSYVKNQNGERTVFSLYLYPAGNAYNGRLRREYQNSLFSIAKEVHAMQYAVQHEGEKYICNGFKAILTIYSNLSQLTLFESGTWFYKIRITTNQTDTTLMTNLEKEILQQFDPTQLTDLKRLEDGITAYVPKSVIRNPTLLPIAIKSGNRQINWVMENVDEKERATGFPDLYLDFHIEALKTFIEFKHEIIYSKRDKNIKEYLNELQLISDAGFLSEFVMEQCYMILIIPENLSDRFEEYQKWKLRNNISIDLNHNLYTLEFRAIK